MGDGTLNAAAHGMSGGPSFTTFVVFLPMIAMLAIIGCLIALAARASSRPETSARQLSMVAVLVALAGSLFFVLWPVELGAGVSSSISVDVPTGQTTTTTTQQFSYVLWPTLRRFGPTAIPLAIIPVVLALPPVAWERVGIRGERAVRIICAGAMLAWLIAGLVFWFSLWSFPAALAMLAAAGRSEPKTNA